MYLLYHQLFDGQNADEVKFGLSFNSSFIIATAFDRREETYAGRVWTPVPD